jgi:hypothetical protein
LEGNFGRGQGSPRTVLPEEEERLADFNVSFDISLRYTGLGL